MDCKSTTGAPQMLSASCLPLKIKVCSVKMLNMSIILKNLTGKYPQGWEQYDLHKYTEKTLYKKLNY